MTSPTKIRDALDSARPRLVAGVLVMVLGAAGLAAKVVLTPSKLGQKVPR